MHICRAFDSILGFAERAAVCKEVVILIVRFLEGERMTTACPQASPLPTPVSQLLSALISQLYSFLPYIKPKEGVSVPGNSFQPSHSAFVIKIILIKVCHGSQSLSANEQ